MRIICFILGIVFGYLTYTAAYMGGVDEVTVGFGALTLVCLAVVAYGGKSGDKKNAKATAGSTRGR